MGQVRDIDKGYAALVKRVFEFHKPQISVGIFEADGAVPKMSSAKVNDLGKTLSAQSVMTLIEVACINEFGGGNTPERSFIRAWFDQYASKNKEIVRRLMESVVRGDRTRDQILQIIGQKFVADIQQRIVDVIPPPNAPSTVARKGSDVPLVDTGQLKSSITYKSELR